MKINHKILLVDDDPDIREFMSYNLKKENYEVYTASNGFDALKLTDKINPDLIILDVMMPGMNGIQICKEIRSNIKNDNILICFLTAKGDDFSQIEGFDAGSDDFVTKPISPNVFLKKIDALLRRSDNSNEAYFEDLYINFDTHTVTLSNKVIVFTKKEFALLKLLVSEPGKVFTREDIYKSIWGNDIIVGDRTIDVHVRKLREKLGEKYIKTLKSIGYKFEVKDHEK